MKVLIADDEATDQLLLQAQVRSLGYECLQASNGIEAWNLIGSEQPDVVISDWRMPGIEGPELCRRTRGLTPYVYFILATALGDPHHMLEGMGAGADNYLSKPIDVHDLQGTLIAATRVTQLHRHLSDSLARRDALLRLARSFSTDHPPERVMRQVVEEAVQLLGADDGELARWNAETRSLVSTARHQLPRAASVRRAVREASAKAAKDRSPVYLSGRHSLQTVSPKEAVQACSVIAAPLQHENQLLGTLTIWSSRPGACFDTDDGELLETLAGVASAALVANTAFDRQRRVVEELKRLNQGKSAFVSIVSHEFRTPLTGIQGFSEMMRDEDLSIDQMKEFADDINKDAVRLTSLVSEMLDLDGLESGNTQLECVEVALNLLIEGTAAELRPHVPQHTLLLDLDPSMPAFLGDSDKLIQMLKSVLDNAFKYSPHGGSITISTRVEKHRAHVTVSDEGIGIPEHALESVFERFHRVDEPEVRHITGSGLGLAIVREITRLHGGRVWAESTPGKGSSIHLTLPFRAEPGRLPQPFSMEEHAVGR